MNSKNIKINLIKENLTNHHNMIIRFIACLHISTHHVWQVASRSFAKLRVSKRSRFQKIRFESKRSTNSSKRSEAAKDSLRFASCAALIVTLFGATVYLNFTEGRYLGAVDDNQLWHCQPRKLSIWPLAVRLKKLCG